MLFNSLSFALFLPIVFMLYWFLAKKSLKAQNILLLFASYYFYGCWDWRFLFHLTFSILLDYFNRLHIHQSESNTHRKIWLWTSIIISLGFLGLFNYYNFFADCFAEILLSFGFKPSFPTLNMIL